MSKILIEESTIEDMIGYFDCDHEKYQSSCCCCALKVAYHAATGKHPDLITRAPGVGRKGLRGRTPAPSAT